jgi:hypothetical protein
LKTYIIDALNYINSNKQLSKLVASSVDNAVSALCSMVAEYLKKFPSFKFIIVIDGTLNEINKYHKNIKLVESVSITADDKIKEIVTLSKSKSLLSVVSDDTEVYNFAVFNGVEAIVCSKFSILIADKYANVGTLSNTSKRKKSKNNEKPITPSKKEIQTLKSIFENEELDMDFL